MTIPVVFFQHVLMLVPSDNFRESWIPSFNYDFDMIYEIVFILLDFITCTHFFKFVLIERVCRKINHCKIYLLVILFQNFTNNNYTCSKIILTALRLFTVICDIQIHILPVPALSNFQFEMFLPCAWLCDVFS